MTTSTQLPTLAADIARLLRECETTYCLIGGLAVVIHGYIRATKDVDFLVDKLTHWEPLVTKSATLGLILHERHREFAKEGLLFLRAETEPTFGVDILRVESTFESDILKRAEVHEIGGTSIQVITLEDLIALKLKVGRPQDDADAEALIDLREQDIKLERLRSTAKALDIETKLEIFLRQPK